MSGFSPTPNAGAQVADCAVASGLRCSESRVDLLTPDIMGLVIGNFRFSHIFPPGDYQVLYRCGALITSIYGYWSVNEGVTGSADTGYYVYIGDSYYPFPYPPGVLPQNALYNSQVDAEAAYAGVAYSFSITSSATIGMGFWDGDYTDNSPGSPNPVFQLLRTG